MKILTFSDVHANKRALDTLAKRAKEADILICAGDFSVFGSSFDEVLSEMNSWGKQLYIIHGNHEDEAALKDIHETYPNIHFVHANETQVQDISILGWGGGGFALEDPELAEFARALEPKSNRILVFHGPPYQTALDFQPYFEEHVGCRTRRVVIEELQPFLVLAGHIHETFGARDQIGRSILLNPGPLGVMIEIDPKEGKKEVTKKEPAKKQASKAKAKKR